jgi:predicted nucleic acid-binding protein
MPYFTYDTSVIISRKLIDFQKIPRSFVMSAIVLMELMAGADDRSRLKIYQRFFRQCQKDNLLIVPNAEDWLLAAKIMYLLAQTRKRSQQGKLQRLPPGASQRLALDVLIAVSARRWKAQVVTENWADFKAIQRYCDTKIVNAAKFFKK